MKKNQDLYTLFTDELADMLSSENQIIHSLPKLIKLASLPDLKKALTNHLEETKNQVKRIENICKILNLHLSKITCEAMQGLVKEAEELVGDKSASSTLDAAIITACQKIEHYEIASYGTLCSFAKHLGFDSEVIEQLKETLDEEENADSKLTDIADGTFLATGVNAEAAKGYK